MSLTFPWCFTISDFACSLSDALERVQKLYFEGDLGHGSIGSVYKAKCPVTYDHFAVKKVQLRAISTSIERVECLQRIAREAAAAKALTQLSPYPDEIVRHFACLYDEGEDTAFIVMQLCKGPCLAKLRSQEPSGRLPEMRVRRMVASVARALGHLHAVGLLCVDLKAENVVLDASEQEPDRVRLLDFDLCRDLPGHNRCEVAAKTADIKGALLSPTAAAAGGDRIWGTPGYLAYEVLQDGAAAYSPASDLWGLGVLAYELLYGTLPWSGASVDAILARMTTHPPAFPHQSEGGPSVISSMQQLIRGLLRARPELRLGSRGGVREVLEHPALLHVSNKETAMAAAQE